VQTPYKDEDFEALTGLVQCVATCCCSVVQCVAVWRSLVHCTVVSCSLLQCGAFGCSGCSVSYTPCENEDMRPSHMICSVLHSGVEWCILLQCLVVWYSVVHFGCSMVQYGAVYVTIQCRSFSLYPSFSLVQSPTPALSRTNSLVLLHTRARIDSFSRSLTLSPSLSRFHSLALPLSSSLPLSLSPSVSLSRSFIFPSLAPFFLSLSSDLLSRSLPISLFLSPSFPFFFLSFFLSLFLPRSTLSLPLL